MNKSELITAMASKSGLSKTDARKSLEAFMASVTDSLSNGERVSLVGFGTFSVSQRAKRTGINPSTKKPIVIPAKKVAKFRPGGDLSEAVE